MPIVKWPIVGRYRLSVHLYILHVTAQVFAAVLFLILPVVIFLHFTRLPSWQYQYARKGSGWEWDDQYGPIHGPITRELHPICQNSAVINRILIQTFRRCIVTVGAVVSLGTFFLRLWIFIDQGITGPNLVMSKKWRSGMCGWLWNRWVAAWKCW